MPRSTRPALIRALGAATLSLGLAAAAAAQVATPPAYTARALHQLADGTVNSGVVVKSGADMRLEYTDAGRAVIQIIRRAEGVMYVLDPAQQTYVEVRGAPPADPTGLGYLPPCQENDPLLSCTLKGTEVSSGITAELWEVAPRDPQQGAGVTTILWDGARHKALRQTMPDGATMQLAFVAMVQIAGRPVEHWSVSYIAPGQPAQSGAWYYDPELRVEVREEMPSGEVRSLEEIAVGAVDPALFQVPAGWTKVDMPAAPQPGAPPPGSGN